MMFIAAKRSYATYTNRSRQAKKRKNKVKEEKLLSKRKINPTASRIIVLRYFLAKDNAISLKNLERDLHQSDKSTLYRTLKTFERQKIIHSIDDGTGIKKYALCLENCECEPQDQHFHFHCIKCEETYCLNYQKIPIINLPPEFSVVSANLVIKGVCVSCN